MLSLQSARPTADPSAILAMLRPHDVIISSAMPRQKPHQTTLNHTLAGVSSLSEISTDSSENTAQALLQLSLALLDSALDILDVHITSDKQLQHESTLMPGGTPGKHFRHVSLPHPLPYSVLAGR